MRHDFNTLLQSYKMIRKAEVLRRWAGLVPGLLSWEPAALKEQTTTVARREAIILSMTPDERRNPDLLDGPRKRRIAQGSGTRVEDVGDLLLHLMRLPGQG